MPRLSKPRCARCGKRLHARDAASCAACDACCAACTQVESCTRDLSDADRQRLYGTNKTFQMLAGVWRALNRAL